MAKIALFLPGNATHSFLLEDRWQKMYDEQLGLNAIGRSGIPVTVSHQGIDYALFPFLKDLHAQYKNISVANAPFGHALLPFLSAKQKKWELRERHGNLPITFFSEFYSPEADFIPTEFFFMLQNQTCSYSMTVGTGNVLTTEPEVDPLLPDRTIAVNYGNHIGIILDGFDRFLKTWFSFASFPNKVNLNWLMNEFELMVKDTRPIIVVPLDIEQPYVGCVVGEKIWETFFGELKRRGLAKHIVGIETMFEYFRRLAGPVRQPHRILTKWTSHLIQLRYLQRLARLESYVRTEKDRMVFSVASSSDLLSSWNRFVLRSNRMPISIQCSDFNGNIQELSQAHNKPLQEMCLAACNVLECGDKNLVDKLSKIENSNMLVRRLSEWAEKKCM